MNMNDIHQRYLINLILNCINKHIGIDGIKRKRPIIRNADFSFKQPPPISLKDYLIRLHTYYLHKTTSDQWLLTYIYLRRFIDKMHIHDIVIDKMNCHVIIYLCFELATIYLDDKQYDIEYKCSVSGLAKKAYTSMMLSFCSVMDYSFFISYEEFNEYKLLMPELKQCGNAESSDTIQAYGSSGSPERLTEL